ncbi:ketoreductase involved in fatty acid elongation [Schizosaccharomyces osmophilus]|uniref:Very-long-chain 3-oxoacyl-CoA reductase n=1 Tax=Schizosaccharomyces osmophilus TaxID=2545709 RepID=A0AAE9WDR6_9SCHI|nr:ketoreductase involved in fatty acid elongation [Schizosaccharomyces osmophilus]WBW74501.1 ketoreductase involved in fatty acid elongation [Schizosaccharomyces osmophilus]
MNVENVASSSGCSTAVTVFSIFGIVYTLLKAKSVAQFLYNNYLAKGTKLTVYGAKHGSWAVVTGATDGIGKEYATQLATSGFNIVLISRTQEKLSALAQELETVAKIQTRTIALDYTKANKDSFEKIAEQLKDLPITILINNVGQSHVMPTSFEETTEMEMDNIMHINCFGTLHTTKAVLPIMMEQRRKDKKGPRCLILTMGSFAGLIPSPYLSTYAGSKAFLSNWSASMAEEVKSEGIDVWCYNSYLVVSSMSKIRRPNMTTPTPKAFVREALGSINVQRGGSTPYISQPYPTHAIMSWSLEELLGNVKYFVVNQVAAMHLDIRKRALKKQARIQQSVSAQTST